MGCQGSKEKTPTKDDAPVRRVSERITSSAIAAGLSEAQRADSKASKLDLSKESSISTADSVSSLPGMKRRMSKHRKLSTSLSKIDATNPNARLSVVLSDAGSLPSTFDENDEDFVYLDEDDEERIDKIQKTLTGQHFQRHELQHILAAFKENDMVLPRGYFHMVYATFARLDSPTVVDRVFDMFDKDRSGNFSFEEFIQFLGTVVKGGTADKVEYFFKMYDKDGDGNLTKAELVDMLASMPSTVIKRSLAFEKVEHLPSLTEEEDESEEAEARAEELRKQREALKDKQEEDAAILAAIKNPDAAPNMGRDEEARAKEAAENRERAIEVVDNCFVEMNVDGDSITLPDFKAHAANSETLQQFFPF
eukprot:TRINITY_DN7286_c0_g1_i4.p1 TRINITY_DN7286_c0_g1~~TRINITY_DN7286_c0_g1_i4.p1  ORF type:complete len:365 (+),score=108.06 TRINITY_DN7286_c0_g1_i4:122-1216(+)